MQKNVLRAYGVGSLLILALGAIFVLSGCGSAAAPAKPANDVIKEGMVKLMEVKSGTYETALNIDLADEESGPMKFNLKASGLLDRTDAEKLQMGLKMDGTGEASGQSGSLAFELRLNSEAMFFNVSKVDVKDMPLPDGVQKYLAKWWKYTITEEMKEQIKTSVPNASEAEMTPEEKQIKELVAKTDFFKAEYKGTKDVKGESSYLYAVTLDKDATVDFLAAVAKIQGEEPTETEIAEMKTAFASVSVTGEITVGTVSGVANSFKGTVKVDKGQDVTTTGTIVIDASLGGINKPAAIEAPAGAEEFPAEEFMGEMMGGTIPTGDTSAIDAADYEIDPADMEGFESDTSLFDADPY